MRKSVCRLISAFILLISLTIVGSVKAELINDFNAQIIINKDGTIDVTEKIVYDFGDPPAGAERHGIFRTIPYTKTNQDNKKFQLDFNDFSVRDEQGNNYRFSQTKDNEEIKLKIGDPDRTITGVKTYIIRYTVGGSLTYFSDHDELYWNVTGNSWTVPISQLTSQVTLPVVTVQSELKFSCYTGYAGSTASDCQQDIRVSNDREILVASNRPLNPNEGLTVAVSFPKGIVTVLEPKPVIDFWETIWGKLVILGLMLLSVLWYIVYPIWIPIKWWLYGRDPQTGGPVRAWYDPPADSAGRPLTAIETGSLVDETCDMKDISAMIVQLAQKGYLKIVEKKKGEFELIRHKTAPDGLLDFEKEFMNGIFGGKKTISVKDEELYEPVKKLRDKLYESMVKEKFFVKNPQSVRTFYSAILGLSSFTFNVPLLVSTLIFGRIMPRKTIFGAQTANVARSLKNFLGSQERQLEFQAKNQLFFEKLLPFAIAFGVEKIWAERFKDIDMAPPDWYEGHGAGRFNSVYWVNSMNSSFSSFRSAATPTSSSSGFSSGFSGGSSGGGGGGGGGGSW